MLIASVSSWQAGTVLQLPPVLPAPWGVGYWPGRSCQSDRLLEASDPVFQHGTSPCLTATVVFLQSHRHLLAASENSK